MDLARQESEIYNQFSWHQARLNTFKFLKASKIKEHLIKFIEAEHDM